MFQILNGVLPRQRPQMSLSLLAILATIKSHLLRAHCHVGVCVKHEPAFRQPVAVSYMSVIKFG